jgi:LysR family transcriptional regulator, transcriptional activator of nhaA
MHPSAPLTPAQWLNFHHVRYFWMVAREGSVTRAAKKLRLTQPTVSAQVHELEAMLGEKLFRREGRRLVLTESGQLAMRFADEIFALGTELVDSVRGRLTGRAARLSVGIADEVPKDVAFRILEPILAMPEPVRVVCHEDTQSRLVALLATHALDVVIADAPETGRHPVSLYNHLLGECPVSVFGIAKLANRARSGFPRSLDDAPFLLPTSGTALRREVDSWLEDHRIAPAVVGEFQDAALLAVFARAGAGLFVGPDVGRANPAGSLPRAGFRRVGVLKPLRQRYYAITAERRLVNPALQTIAGGARSALRWHGDDDARRQPRVHDARAG